MLCVNVLLVSRENVICNSGNIGSLISSLPAWRHVLEAFEKEDKLVVPLSSRNLQFSSTSRLPIIQELFLISFGKVSVVGIRIWKASFWSDTGNYLLLPRWQLYVHVYINRDQNQLLVSKSASLPTTLKLFLAANISTAFPPAYVNCFDVYFISLKILEVYTIKSCSVFSGFIPYRVKWTIFA